ncbi:MAG: MFS transporter [Chloroflexota bacterium]
MRLLRNLIPITLADFIVRSAYQMGKTPLLPIFAATLGATDAFLGFIVSVSTFTGLVLKPLFGILSDRWGRRLWLIIGTLFFALMPFSYQFIETPGQLLIVRCIHGLSTAIYGPVTLAYVSEQAQDRRAEWLGWFGSARNAGYVVGPAVAGWMLLTLDPVVVFTVIGLVSSVALLPISLLQKSTTQAVKPRIPLRRHIVSALRTGAITSSIWLAGSMEAVVYIASYATKAFLPIYALSEGINVVLVGAFFSVQEIAHIILRPFGGRLGDRLSYSTTVALGMTVLGVALCLLTLSTSPVMLLSLAVLMGAAQAIIFPSTVALVSTQVDEQHLGAGLGIVGSLKNAGKVTGPILAGIMIQMLDYGMTFRIIGVALILGACLITYRGLRLLPPVARSGLEK